MSDEIVDRILSQSRTDVATTAPAAAPPDALAARRDARLVRWQAAFGVAAAVALVLAIVLATRAGGPNVPGSVVVAFEGAAPGQVALAYTPGEPGALRVGDRSPRPGTRERVRACGCSRVTSRCSARVSRRMTERSRRTSMPILSSAELMAVTVESAACPDAPTTDPVYTAELDTSIQ